MRRLILCGKVFSRPTNSLTHDQCFAITHNASKSRFISGLCETRSTPGRDVSPSSISRHRLQKHKLHLQFSENDCQVLREPLQHLLAELDSILSLQTQTPPCQSTDGSILAQPYHSAEYLGRAGRVAQLISKPLQQDDRKGGMLYIYHTPSSLGHVKIGYTMQSVEKRLKQWSQCGEHATLLLATERIDLASRVESLVHQELAELRRKIYCRRCNKWHNEWFEISHEKAAQVVKAWSDIAATGTLYGSDGSLNQVWARSVKFLEGQNDGNVTAEALLQRYKGLSASSVRLWRLACRIFVGR